MLANFHNGSLFLGQKLMSYFEGRIFLKLENVFQKKLLESLLQQLKLQ